MREYEMVREIFNLCANNQMRDVFFEEVETDDPEAYVRNFLDGKIDSLEKSICSDGSIRVDVNVSGLYQRFTFTPV